jgi:phenylacetate-CoA ligase
VADCADVARARVEVTGSGKSEQIEVKLECSDTGSQDYAAIVQDILKLRSKVTTVEVGSLPRDGILVSDLREVP